MSNEKVVQVIVKGEQVMGLTDSGHLAVFDDNLNAFKIRGKSEVFDRDHKVVLSSVSVTPRAMATASHEGKLQPKKKDRVDLTLVAMAITFALISLSVLVYVMLRVKY